MKRGGDFIAEGGFTCVYSPPLTCRGQPDLPAGKYVSRIVDDPSEIEIQTKVKEVIAKTEAEHLGKVSKYFNLMVSACDEFTIKPTDIHPNKRGEVCTNYPKLQTPGEIKKADGLYNIITPRQHQPLVVFAPDSDKVTLTRSRSETLKGFKSLLEALVYIRGAFIHNDTHMLNIGWMLDGRLVLFDWGRTIVTEFESEFSEKIEHAASIYQKQLDYDETDIDFKILAMVQGTQDVERLRVVWDILGILDTMRYVGILRNSTAIKVADSIIALLKVGVPSQDDLFKIINQVFQNQTAGTRRRRRRRKTIRK